MAWKKICLLISYLAVVFAQDFDECGRTLPENDIKGYSKYNEAKVGEFPHMCTLYTQTDDYNVHIGGASLISSNQVLTLATGIHQMRNYTLEQAREAEDGIKDVCEESHDIKRTVFVSCGGTKLQGGSNDKLNKQSRRVSKILIHPEYNPRSLINDLAVLILEKPFNFTTNIGRVCLPRPQETVKSDTTLVATGYGRDQFEFGIFSRDLRKVNLPAWDNIVCEKTLNEQIFLNTSAHPWTIHPSFMCAGGKDQEDTCEGDGGGPLVCNKKDLLQKGQEEIPTVEEDDDIFGYDENDVFGDADDNDIFNDEVDLRTIDTSKKIVQIGVTAWGKDCGLPGRPSVYSSVTEGRCWLDQVMSCYKTDMFIESSSNTFDLRTTGAAPNSDGELTQEECGAWLEKEASRRAACGCKQILIENEVTLPIEESSGDVDLRQIDED